MVKRNNDKGIKKLKDRGWRYDGLWWYSPYTKTRYQLREALHVEELRAWSESDSAFLNDKDHSMWVKKEMEDNALTSMEGLSESSKKRQALKQKGIDSCYESTP